MSCIHNTIAAVDGADAAGVGLPTWQQQRLHTSPAVTPVATGYQNKVSFEMHIIVAFTSLASQPVLLCYPQMHQSQIFLLFAVAQKDGILLVCMPSLPWSLHP